MVYQEPGRQNLSPDILRIIDSKVISYQEMLPGQSLRIHAEDAVTKQPGFFDITVLSVRDTNEHGVTKTATFQYNGGDFKFYDGADANQPVQLQPGTLMENGISAVLVPQTDYRLVYFGGIGLSRDHSFEFVEGKDKSVIVHGVRTIEVGEAPTDFQAPDLSSHFERVNTTRQRYMEDEKRRAIEVNRVVMALLEKRFSEHPDYNAIRDLIAGYSPNGKIAILSYLTYAMEDKVLDQAWVALKQADKDDFSYDPPMVRGDLGFKASNWVVYMDMMRTAGVKWPRPEK